MQGLVRARGGRPERERVHGVVRGRSACSRHGVGLTVALPHLRLH